MPEPTDSELTATYITTLNSPEFAEATDDLYEFATDLAETIMYGPDNETEEDGILKLELTMDLLGEVLKSSDKADFSSFSDSQRLSREIMTQYAHTTLPLLHVFLITMLEETTFTLKAMEKAGS